MENSGATFYHDLESGELVDYSVRYFIFDRIQVPYWLWRCLPLWRRMELY